ncbi:MAG TPA: 30S ribosomal protein S6 [Phycisphaerae bacterium]|jgi:small subunit ribosomal protein S6|nr:30S ribosomal protein S6 [Phycisphaerae bacterium]HOJ54769.1 30S ribosomal protein S6 [Phycisphaerae bacterium]HOL25879.1 30S ribosomal protein S6 [Phycisphaerae bacterium]HPP21189.1 30S ribosomal protein S6 [Phycisphaerae bacterium]HPU31967.1 30S ribosomal protein S6 [Phycisphaerae bacterium]
MKYEGMFLFDPAVTTDWEAVQAELERLMKRAEARVIVMQRWDERRLAYEIRGRKRAIYALTYFEADPSKIAPLERDAQISEAILRCLVLKADHLTEEEMKELAARPPDHSAADAERYDTRGGGGRESGSKKRREGAPETVEAEASAEAESVAEVPAPEE